MIYFLFLCVDGRIFGCHIVQIFLLELLLRQIYVGDKIFRGFIVDWGQNFLMSPHYHPTAIKMDSAYFNDIAKNLIKVSKGILNVLGKVLESMLIFPPCLIILKRRVKQWFMKLGLVLVTLETLRISALYGA